MRPTLIIGDDIEEDGRVLNPDLRDKDSRKLNKVIIPALDINGRFKFIGTILHIESLLMKKIEQYKGKIYAACDENMENLLWPQRFTKAKLEEIKKDIGTVSFQQEYLNNPTDTKNTLIDKEWVEQCYDATISKADVEAMEMEYKVLGVDFAFSDRILADNSSFISLGLKTKKMYLIDSLLEHGKSLNEQIIIIQENLNIKYQYDMIGLEENSIRANTKDLLQLDLPLKLFWTAAQDPSEKQKEYKNVEWTNKRHTVGKLALMTPVMMLTDGR